MARQNGFASAGGFSNYYDSFGANLPNGYWLEWLQHWLTQSSNTLILLRVPALICLGGTWVLARWIFARISPSSHETASAHWALAATFLVGALAWGMTLRPEPASLIVTALLACSVQFVRTKAAAPLAVAALLIPLAITGHHAGLVACAPLLAIATHLLPWIRVNFAAATALGTAFMAALIGLAFLGSDIGQRAQDAQLIRTYAVNDAWYDELNRYAYLSGVLDRVPLTAVPIRREAFAFIALAILAYILRRRRVPNVLLDLPSRTLILMLLLLIAVPSKWPWHFGTAIGVAAVAIAAETTRLRDDAASSRGWRLRPFVVVAVAALVAAWAWGPGSRGPWWT